MLSPRLTVVPGYIVTLNLLESSFSIFSGVSPDLLEPSPLFLTIVYDLSSFEGVLVTAAGGLDGVDVTGLLEEKLAYPPDLKVLPRPFFFLAAAALAFFFLASSFFLALTLLYTL